MSEALDLLSDEARARLRAQEHPRWVEPMLATLTDERFSDPGWIYERKLDGVRCLAFRHGDLLFPADLVFFALIKGQGGELLLAGAAQQNRPILANAYHIVTLPGFEFLLGFVKLDRHTGMVIQVILFFGFGVGKISQDVEGPLFLSDEVFFL